VTRGKRIFQAYKGRKTDEMKGGGGRARNNKLLAWWRKKTSLSKRGENGALENLDRGERRLTSQQLRRRNLGV